MELLNFDNLMATLEEYAEEVRNLYQDKLIQGDRIASGNLLNSVEYQVVDNGREYLVQLSLADYWKYLEYGISGAGNSSSPFSNPGWKAFPHILNWIKVKPVLPRPDRNGKLPSQKSLAYLITRSIVKNGIEPGNELHDTLEEVNARYKDKLIYSLRKDTERILKVMVGGIQGSVPTYD